jgi:cellulose synthase/poly-beta-1,6-N-acetylglucosamine synthase-like glycosyltransferase
MRCWRRWLGEMEVIFLTAVFLVFHAYFGYPLSLRFLGLFRGRPVRKAPFLPSVTLIITACNEEKRIVPKMENTIHLEYPRERLQILVASDGSTDRTNEIVAGYEKHGVELFAIEQRRGKEYAQKEAVRRARGDILVFSDVATRLDPDGMSQIVSNFADPSVGCVSSEDRLAGTDGKPGGEGLYVRYEMWLRKLESRAGSLVGLSGSFFAARKEVCAEFSEEMQSDFRTLLNSIRLGLRGVIDSEAVGHYSAIADEKKEFDRKVRTVLRGLTVFFRHLEFLNPIRYGFFSYQYACHKLLRWLVPFLLTAAFAASACLSLRSVPYLFLFLAQSSFYAVGAAGAVRGESFKGIWKIPVYFLTVNASILVAWGKFLIGERVVMWTPSER